MSEVISDKQRQLNASLHKDNNRFGNRSDGAGLAGHLPAALERMHELGICNSMLDYGTGKGALIKRLKAKLSSQIDINGYDPAIKQFATRPNKAVDILICLDVLEHIEMESIDPVLRDIQSLTKQFCYLVIDLQPAVKKLADGRNAHILLAPPEWWVSRLSQLFPCVTSFPVMHKAGIPQKLVLACCHTTNILPLVYGFLVKLKIFDFHLKGGILQGVVEMKSK